jgi:hypothetical protein
MNKNELLTLTDDQVEQIVGAHHRPDHPQGGPPGQGCPEITTLACGEEGECSGC